MELDLGEALMHTSEARGATGGYRNVRVQQTEVEMAFAAQRRKWLAGQGTRVGRRRLERGSRGQPRLLIK